MALAKCLCGRHTDFGTLCVFCARDKILDKADESSPTTEKETLEDTEQQIEE